MLELLDFNENPNVGVFCRANDNLAFVRTQLLKKIKKKIVDALDVKLVELNIADATIIGSLLSVNSTGAIVTDFIDEKSLQMIKDQGLSVCVIEDIYNAAGNDVLMNDYGALVHPDLGEKVLHDIKQTCDVPVYRGTVGTLKTVGMAAVATNKGCLCHPKVTDEEKRRLEEVFQVPVMIGTVNHGAPLIGSGLVANTKGAIIGNRTTGIEMGRIEEALGFLG
ncbi:MAG: translation initiation factor IF-6 [Candidatus Thermoplasmatota archaeon]|nr:translation initiation factor IF-6 [Candidatus Thermoplasmatota archaeon]